MKNKDNLMLFLKLNLLVTFMTFLAVPCASGGSGHINNVSHARCASGGYQVVYSGVSCNTTVGADEDGRFGFGSGQEFQAGSNTATNTYIGNWDVYAPYNGLYKMNLHLCAGVNSQCTVASSISTAHTALSQELSSSRMISSTNSVNFGGLVGPTTTSAVSACYTLVGPYGDEWRSTDMTSCPDAPLAPTTPADCYLNYGADLNIDMGKLERSSLASTAKLGTVGNVKRQFSVLCTRDASITVSTVFNFSPITIDGNNVAATSSQHLGIAIFYQGKPVSPTSTPIIETYSTGITNRELEFQAVRDPNVSPGDISTGNFTSSVVMIMNQN